MKPARRLQRTLLRPISRLQHQHQSQPCASELEMSFPQERNEIVDHLATTRTLAPPARPDGRIPSVTLQRGTT